MNKNSNTEFIRDNNVEIHSSAFVDSKAQIHSGVKVEQGAIIGPNVIIESGTRIGPNAVIQGKTKIGKNNIIFPSAFIGLEPQDLKYKGADSELIIGDNNTFRECVTINKATDEHEQTVIGNNNLLMAYTHIGHNCHIGNNTVLSNSVQVAGHVKIEDNAIVGGCLGIHQFVHIGYLAMVGGMTRVDRDVPPFSLAEGHPGRLRGLNRVGIKRSSLIENNLLDQKLLQKIWNLLFKSEFVVSKALDLAMREDLDVSSNKLCNFVRESISKNRRGFMPAINS
tara:strand:+ start:16026 stop:16868 length:843 start_codon:yes stop_codon:yes gene_type:complete